MIFSAIIALFFGLLLASFEIILAGRMGPLLTGLLVAVFAFLGSQRLAHNKPVGEWIVGGVGTLLPVWLLTYYAVHPSEFRAYIPALGIITAAIVAAIALTVWWQNRHQ